MFSYFGLTIFSILPISKISKSPLFKKIGGILCDKLIFLDHQDFKVSKSPNYKQSKLGDVILCFAIEIGTISIKNIPVVW